MRAAIGRLACAAVLGWAGSAAADGAPAVANGPDQGMVQIAQAAKPARATNAADDSADDPLESINRAIFNANEFIYALILRPFADFYRLLLPPPIQTAVLNVLDNLRAPVVLANNILQGDGARALQTGQRLVINTTLGVGGIMDPATDMGILPINEDFGQTLGVWGVGDLPYLVLPLLGPTSPRDAVGKYFVDGHFDPLGYYLDNTHRDDAANARRGVGAVDEYGRVMHNLDSLKLTSIDYYAAIRSLYRQKRRADIANGGDTGLPPMPNINYDVNFSAAPSH